MRDSSPGKVLRAAVATDGRIAGCIQRRALVAALAFAIGSGCNCDQQVISLQRILVATPVVLDFGDVPAGSLANATVTVKSTGRAAVHISAFTITNDPAGAFSTTATANSLASGAALTVPVVLTAPAQVGPLLSDLQILSDAGKTPDIQIVLKANVLASCATLTCPTMATCQDSSAGPTCMCPDGDTMSNGTCVTAHPCATNNGGCSAHATCQDGAPAVCTCDPGYVGDGLACSPPSLSLYGAHTCAIKPDATLWCWGPNSQGELGNGTTVDSSTPLQVSPGTTWMSVGAGLAHTCGVQTNGTLWCWGGNFGLQLGTPALPFSAISTTPRQIGTDSNWASVTSGDENSCAVRTDGTLWCWGGNAGRQTSPENENGVPSPNQYMAQPGNTWISMSSGTETCGIQSDGTLWCWGNGSIGNGEDGIDPTPVQVGSGTYLSVSVDNDYTSCAVATDHTLWCWGSTPYLLGTTPMGNVLLPAQIDSAQDWSTVAVGGAFICGTKMDHTVWCAGGNAVGELGNGGTTASPTFVQAGTEQDWAVVVAGISSACAESTTGQVSCWGDDGLGTLGDGAAIDTTPTQVAPGTTWKQVALGSSTGFGIQSDGSLWEWGVATHPGDTWSSATPARVGTATDWASVHASQSMQCAVDTGGNLWCFGSDANGQLGDGATTAQPLPIRVGSGGWLAVAPGEGASCAIHADNTLWCWGSNAGYAFGDGTTTGSPLPKQIGTSLWSSISQGFSGGCGISVSGTLSWWGSNSANGPVTTPMSVAGVWTSAVFSQNNVCALGTDGTVGCWGDDSEGQLGGSGSAGSPAIVPGQWKFLAGAGMTRCAIKADGSLWCWGALSPLVPHVTQTTPMQLGTGSAWISVAVSDNLEALPPGTFISPLFGEAVETICAIRSDESLWCWGANGSGQRGDGHGWRTTPAAVSF
jgi:alpha-tubulin suppressor-like RCC1 family protein